MFLYICRQEILIWWFKGVLMFSEEFMHFLIKYQQPAEPPKKIDEIKTISFKKSGNKLAEILLTVKK